MAEESERDHFVRRAAIERVAAMMAISWNAKSIHLELAQRYELLALEAEELDWAQEQGGRRAVRR
jgi:hypothetical protein